MLEDTLHIIHLSHREDRMETLKDELRLQQVARRKIWEGIHDLDCPAKGILKAHQQIVSFAKENELKKIIIAEDDVKFTAKGAWRYYVHHAPADFDLYLGGITWGTILEDHTVNDFSGTSLYTISEKFYDTFLGIKPDTDFDRQLAGKGAFVVCQPMVACQHDGFSDNQKRDLNFGPLLRRKKWFTG